MKHLLTLALAVALTACSTTNQQQPVEQKAPSIQKVLAKKIAKTNKHIDIVYGRNKIDINNDGIQDLVVRNREEGYDSYMFYVKQEGKNVSVLNFPGLTSEENSECVTTDFAFEQTPQGQFLINKFYGENQELTKGVQDIYKSTYVVKEKLISLNDMPYELDRIRKEKLDTKYCDVSLALEKNKNKSGSK